MKGTIRCIRYCCCWCYESGDSVCNCVKGCNNNKKCKKKKLAFKFVHIHSILWVLLFARTFLAEQNVRRPFSETTVFQSKQNYVELKRVCDVCLCLIESERDKGRELVPFAGKKFPFPFIYEIFDFINLFRLNRIAAALTCLLDARRHISPPVFPFLHFRSKKKKIASASFWLGIFWPHTPSAREHEK